MRQSKLSRHRLSIKNFTGLFSAHFKQKSSSLSSYRIKLQNLDAPKNFQKLGQFYFIGFFALDRFLSGIFFPSKSCLTTRTLKDVKKRKNFDRPKLSLNKPISCQYLTVKKPLWPINEANNLGTWDIAFW